MSYFLVSQENLDFKVTVKGLEDNTLILRNFKGTEALSELFEFVGVFQSSETDLALEDLIGGNIVLKMKIGTQERYFGGILGRFTQGTTLGAKSEEGLVYYQATIYPSLWKLRFTKDCRIFQEKSALEIIKALLGEYKISFEDKTQGAGASSRLYCVQYNESAFNFISRLMEEEGIYYYFSHSAKGDTLILAESSSPHKPITGQKAVELALSESQSYDFNRVIEAHYEAQMVSKEFQHSDFDYEKPETKLYNTLDGDAANTFGTVYEYPGNFKETSQGESLANIHLEEIECLKTLLRGVSTSPFFCPGFLFSLKKHSRKELNQDYLLTRVSHSLEISPQGLEGLSYSNNYEALPSTTAYRPLRKTLKPTIQGTQTAIVTGKAQEEIWTDNYGRIKVKFHWDHRGKEDESSSCWIRVAQGWAGNGWGILFIPRIGMEVVVSFLNGDPDYPLITGAVYNAVNPPPYLPDEPTKSTILSRSSKKQKGFNELRFEDKAGEEEFWMHAQRDMNVVVIQDRTTMIEKGDDSLAIQKGSYNSVVEQNYNKALLKGDETILLEKGNRKITLNKGDEEKLLKKGDRTVTLEKGDETKTLKKGNFTHDVKGNYDLTVGGNMTITVKGELTIKVSKDYTLKVTKSIKQKASENITTQAEKNLTNKSGKDLTNNASMNLTNKSGTALTNKGGTDLKCEAGTNLTLKAGAMGKLESGAVMTVKGALVKIN